MIHYRYRRAFAVFLIGAFVIAAIQTVAFRLDVSDPPKGYQGLYNVSTNLQIATALMFLGSIIFSGLALLTGKPRRVHWGLRLALLGAGAWAAACTISATYLIRAPNLNVDHKFAVSILTGLATLLLTYLPSTVEAMKLRQLNRNEGLIRIQKGGGGTPRVRDLEDNETILHISVFTARPYTLVKKLFGTHCNLYMFNETVIPLCGKRFPEGVTSWSFRVKRCPERPGLRTRPYWPRDRNLGS